MTNHFEQSTFHCTLFPFVKRCQADRAGRCLALQAIECRSRVRVRYLGRSL